MESVRLACVRHAASVHPEPGSNSPSRLLVNPFSTETNLYRKDLLKIRESPCMTPSMVTTGHTAPQGQVPGSNEPALLLIDVQPKRTEMRVNCPHWLLALTIPFSRSDRAHTTTADVGAGCSEGLFRTDCSAGKSPSAAGSTLGGHSDGRFTVPGARRTVNALCTKSATRHAL